MEHEGEYAALEDRLAVLVGHTERSKHGGQGRWLEFGHPLGGH